MEDINEDHQLSFRHITESQTTDRENKYSKTQVNNIANRSKPKVY